jgi:hypothetical protein
MGTSSSVSKFLPFSNRRYSFSLFRGVWPVCDILPTEQEQMPVEESANMLLMLAAIVQKLDTTDFLRPYWNVMEIWAQYLNNSLPDPGNQLCTDDFVCYFLSVLEKNKSIHFFCCRKDHHHIIVI